MKKVMIAELMVHSGVAFGTSGARGLVTDMTDAVCYSYTAGFIQYLESSGVMHQEKRCIAIAGDLRPSTRRIMLAVAQAVSDRGYQPVNAGEIPSPAVANYGLQKGIPTVMVTGSHIPEDRNGIKYNTALGEILKADEAGIRVQQVPIPDIFDASGMLRNPSELPPVNAGPRNNYLMRYLNTFPANFLAGQRIGLYQHSAVGRDILAEIFSGLGAEVVCLQRSDTFIPVDTEAIRQEDIALAVEWAQKEGFDTIISTDGDSDRPLIADEQGKWLRGDVAGILCARFCQADVVVVPVSCNTAVERCGWFREVRRTRIGSPYVIAELQHAVQQGALRAVGYEANGGFLTASPIQIENKVLSPLPTRDPVIVQLAILSLSMQQQKPISRLLEELPQRFTASDRIQHMPTETSKSHIEALIANGEPAITQLFPQMGAVAATDTTDGLRITFQQGEIIHLRPSGNAPELRCYTEADSEARAQELVKYALARLDDWRS